MSRSYSLEKDKLEALTKLMSRQDVSIRVRPGEDQIEVQATEGQHEAFGAFVNMIEGKEEKNEVRGYRLAEGKLQDLTALMTRQDVPILVEPSQAEIRVHGTPSQHAVFQDFVDLLDGSEPRRTRWTAPRSPRASAGTPSLFGQQEDYLQRLAEYVELGKASRVNVARRGGAARAIRDTIKSRLSEIKAHAKSLEHQAGQLDKQAERLEEQAGKLRKKAEEMREKADAAEPTSESEQMRAEAGAMEGDADRVQAEAEAVREQVSMLEAQAEAMDSEAEAIEEDASVAEAEEDAEAAVAEEEAEAGAR